MAPVIHCVDDWLRVNQQYFQPPTCVKTMYSDGQMIAFFVGGPNSRDDYHLEEGEEFFYQVKGDMCLKVIERGKHRDIFIREGEVFLLPKRIEHSPRRYENTTGLVIERQRNKCEMDCLRYFTEDYKEILYEKWMHLDYFSNQITSAINEYKNSEQYRTKRPIPDTITNNPPFFADKGRTLNAPFCLTSWIQKHRQEIDEKGKKKVFEGDYKSQIIIYGKGKHDGYYRNEDTLLWQWAQESNVSLEGKTYRLKQNHTILIKAGEKWTLHTEDKGLTLAITMCFNTY